MKSLAGYVVRGVFDRYERMRVLIGISKERVELGRREGRAEREGRKRKGKEGKKKARRSVVYGRCGNFRGRVLSGVSLSFGS